MREKEERQGVSEGGNMEQSEDEKKNPRGSERQNKNTKMAVCRFY